jgi:hypothetical protein
MTDSAPENSIVEQSEQKAAVPNGDVKKKSKSSLQRFQEEIRDAVQLMEFAIKNGRTVDDATLDRIKHAENYLQETAQWPNDAERATFEKAYRDLAIFMKPITIETLLSTQDGYHGRSRSWFSSTFFPHSSDAKLFSKKLWAWVILCAPLIVLAQTASDVYGAGEQTVGSASALLILFGKPLIPFLYGLLGALTYLLRSAHSYISDRSFDMNRIPEYYNRMLLGFISGGIVLLFVDPKSFGIGDGAIAFIVGYNTDYLFDMIERLANGIFPKVNLTVTPKDSASSKPGIAKIQIAPSAKVLEPGDHGNAKVTLTAPAPPDGVIVGLSADHAITIPQTVSVQAGATSAQFTFSVGGEATAGTASITASANASSASDSVQIQLVLALRSITAEKKNNQIVGTIMLDREAATDDVRVSVAVDKGWCHPTTSQLAIPKGQKQADFTATLDANAAGTVSITATLGKSQKTAQVTV